MSRCQGSFFFPRSRSSDSGCVKFRVYANRKKPATGSQGRGMMALEREMWLYRQHCFFTRNLKLVQIQRRQITVD